MTPKNKNVYRMFLITLNFCLSISAGFAQTTWQDEIVSNFAKATSFEDLFEPVATIHLSDSVLIAMIDALDIDSQGNLVLTDIRGQNVLLFDNKGALQRRLTAENYHPGLLWRPMRAKFSIDEKTILVQLSGEPFFIFDTYGVCIGRLNYPNFVPYDFCIDQHYFIYGYNFYSNDFYLSRLDTTNGSIRKFGQGKLKFKNINYRVDDVDHMVIDKQGNLFYTHASGPEIYKYSTDGRFFAKYSNTPAYYNPPDRDLPEFGGNIATFMQTANKILKNKTITRSIHLLTPEILLIQYYLPNKSKSGLDFCTIGGKYLLKNNITINSFEIVAKYGYLVTVTQPKIQADGSVPNPVLHKFTLK